MRKLLTTNELQSVLINVLNRFSKFDPLMYDFSFNLYSIGARYHELIYMNNWKKVDNQFLILTTLKYSKMRRIDFEEVSSNLIQSVDSQINVYDKWSTSQYNYYFTLFNNNRRLMHKNKILTSHAFRHLKTKTYFENSGNLGLTLSYMGFKDIKNCLNYIESEIYLCD